MPDLPTHSLNLVALRWSHAHIQAQAAALLEHERGRRIGTFGRPDKLPARIAELDARLTADPGIIDRLPATPRRRAARARLKQRVRERMEARQEPAQAES